METTINEPTSTFFAGLLDWDSIKIANVSLHCIVVVLGPFLLLLAVWYERQVADVIYRTLINQLLSYLFFFQAIFCVASRFSYLVNFCLAPNPIEVCDLSILAGRFGFTFMIGQVTIRQIIKYLYIFNWKSIVGLNDNFMAFYLTMANLLISFCICFSTYLLGFHNEELDFHICTGKSPMENVAEFMKLSHLPMNTSIPGWLQHRYGKDPLEVISFLVLSIQILVVAQTWMYEAWIHLKFTIKLTGFRVQLESTTTPKMANDKFLETDSNIFGSLQTFIMISFCIAAFVPHFMNKSLAKLDPDKLNQGVGRLGVYFSKTVIPIVFFIVLPLLLFAFNGKARKTIIRELRAKTGLNSSG